MNIQSGQTFVYEPEFHLDTFEPGFDPVLVGRVNDTEDAGMDMIRIAVTVSGQGVFLGMERDAITSFEVRADAPHSEVMRGLDGVYRTLMWGWRFGATATVRRLKS